MMDQHRLAFIQNKVYEAFQCTVPWLTRFKGPGNDTLPVCPGNVSAEASRTYMDYRHPPMDPAWKPCACMTLTTSLLSVVKDNFSMVAVKDNFNTTMVSKVKDNYSTVTIIFDELIDVSKEVIAFTFFQMVAEVGGFIALILGISFMDLMRVAEFLKDKMMSKFAEQK